MTGTKEYPPEMVFSTRHQIFVGYFTAILINYCNKVGNCKRYDTTI